MRTLVEEICWVISPNRKYPITINKTRFYNPLVGHFYADNTEAEYDEEEVLLTRCEMVRKAFRPMNKVRVLAPYALCSNDYEGCWLCNCHFAMDKMYESSKCPYVLSDSKVWLNSENSTIGFYKCWERISYQRKSYNKLMFNLGIPKEYLIFGKPFDDRISTDNLSHLRIMEQGQTCDMLTFEILLEGLGKPRTELLRYIFSDETAHFSQKVILMTRKMSDADLIRAFINLSDNPRVRRIIQKIRKNRMKAK